MSTDDAEINKGSEISEFSEKPNERKDSESLSVILHRILDIFSNWFAHPKKRKYTIQVIIAAFALIIIWMIIPGSKSIGEVASIGKKVGYLSFYIGQSVLPIIGFPIIPFLVVGSFSFSFWSVLIGTAIAQAIQLPLVYLIGQKLLTPVIKNLSDWFEFPILKLENKDQVKFIFFIKLLPGLSQTLRHYILAVYKVPFRHFFIISWSMSMAFSIMVLLICQTLKTGGGWNLYIVVAFAVVLIALVLLLRSRSTPPPET